MPSELTTTDPILVVGTGRSGTSAVAGVLHFLGVDMGGPFMQTPKDNPYGTFEDQYFMQLNAMALRGNISQKEWLDKITEIEQQNEGKLWGRKDPATTYLLKELVPRPYRFVWCVRNSNAVINSYVKCYGEKYGWNATRSEQIINDRMEKLTTNLPNERTVVVNFEELLHEPSENIQRIDELLSLSATTSQIQLATQHIRRHKHG